MMRKIFRSPVTSLILFLIAAGLLLGASIGGTRAALEIQSNDYVAEIVLDEIDVALTENGTEVPNGGMLLVGFPKGETFTLGKAFDEVLAVRNNGAINEYVRVSVYKYWEKNGERAVDLDPSLIDLHFVTGEGWFIDEASSTPERTVLYYYTGAVAPGGDTTPFADTLAVSTRATGPAYTDVYCCIAAYVDGVQDHNAAAAITSAWGHNYLGLVDPD